MAGTLLVGLLGAICWGVAPIFGKLGLRHIHPMDGLVARTGVTLGFLLLWVIGTGGMSRLKGIDSSDWFYLGVEAFLATLAGDLAYYAALKWGSAGHAAVILSVSPVVTAWAANLFLGESMSPTQFLGIALVTLGVFLVASGGGGG